MRSVPFADLPGGFDLQAVPERHLPLLFSPDNFGGLKIEIDCGIKPLGTEEQAYNAAERGQFAIL